jgi:hypothetical protein
LKVAGLFEIYTNILIIQFNIHWTNGGIFSSKVHS